MAPHLLVLSACAAVFAVSTAGMLRGVEPFATWFYPLAWYPTLVAADEVIRMRTGRRYLFGDPGFAVSAFLWSLPFWLFFEVLNLRMANWYYVFLPDEPVARWTGVLVSFATVLPAVLASRRLLEVFGFARDLSSARLRVAPELPAVLQATGVLFFAAALAWPRVFFPLIWGGVTLLVDPWVYRRDPERSLLGALERGRPGVIAQLLVGGLAIGFLWELYNTQARGKWIYTVPGLDELRLFEMPLLGFLGFPVLALDGWAVWNALVLARLAREPSTATAARPRLSPMLLSGAATFALAFSVAALLGMERFTVTSTTPRLDALVGEGAEPLALAGYDAFALAAARPEEIAAATMAPEPAARDWVRRARLATLRGIGGESARYLERAGIRTLAELAVADPEELTEALVRSGMPHPRRPRVAHWVAAARDAMGLPD